MKRIFKIDIKKIVLCLGVAVVVFLAECGLELTGVDVPSSGTANNVSTFTMHCGVRPRIQNGTYTTKLIIGFMAPKSWHAAQNTEVSFTSPIGGETLAVVPSTEKEVYGKKSYPDALKQKYGICGNLVDDVEWVVFSSSKAYTLNNNQDFDFDVVIKCKLGPENMLVKLGFYYGTSQEGVSDGSDYNKMYPSNCFSVTGADGDIVDFCNPQLAVLTPVKSLDNDIVTVTFDNSILPTSLANSSDIYFCGKAVSTTGEVFEVCEQTAKTKLTDIGGKKFRIDFWPKGFFNVGSAKTLSRIEYYFTDASGSVKVGYNNTSDAFKYTFKCPN